MKVLTKYKASCEEVELKSHRQIDAAKEQVAE
jgi:hypothetical protein